MATTKKMAAQAQAQKQGEITALESMELVRCLLRVSVYHVAYLRGLFPEKTFKGVDMQNLDGLHIKMLDRRQENEEARRLIDWVEGGVVDAIRKKYLKKLFFGIAQDEDAKRLLEEYVFSFSYDDQGGVEMKLGTKGGKFSSQGGTQKADVNSVKYQVVRLMRMLVGICQTLEQVPEERFLFMKLTYYDHTPEDYEPPFFTPAGERAVGAFPRKPFTMQVGNVATDHHAVELHVKSVLDTVDNLAAEEGPHAECLSGEQENSCTEMSDARGTTQQGEQASMGEESMGGFSPNAKAASPCATAQPKQEGDSISCMAGVPGGCSPKELERVKEYVLRRTQVHLLDALGYLSTMSSPIIEACFAELVAGGVLQRTGEADTFLVVKQALPPVDHQEITMRISSLAVDHSRLGSQLGGVHSVGGTQQTQSEAAPPKPFKRKAAAQEEEEEQSSPAAALAEVWMDGTQASGRGAPMRKVSLVENTIHQRQKRAKASAEREPRMTRAAGRMASMKR